MNYDELEGRDDLPEAVSGVEDAVDALIGAGYDADVEVQADKARIHLDNGHTLEYANGAVRDRVSVPAQVRAGGVGIVGKRNMSLLEEQSDQSYVEALMEADVPITGNPRDER